MLENAPGDSSSVALLFEEQLEQFPWYHFCNEAIMNSFGFHIHHKGRIKPVLASSHRLTWSIK